MNLGITPGIKTNFHQTQKAQNSKHQSFGIREFSPEECINIQYQKDTHNTTINFLRNLIEINPEKKAEVVLKFKEFVRDLPYNDRTLYDLKEIAENIKL